MKKYLVSLFFVISSCAFSENVDVFVKDDVYVDYLKFVNNRDVLTIDNFDGESIRRDVVDIILAQQALAIGGFEHTFSLYPGRVNFRNTKMMQSGQLLMSFDSYWLNDANKLTDSLYISLPVIRNGEYLAGIYTSHKNTKTLAIKTLADFQHLTAVSTPLWRTDWQTLERLQLKALIQENEWLSMARMVHKNWVDFILMPFNSTPDKSFTLKNISLIPVPNMAVLLKDSRHFVIGKKHPKSKEAISAMNIGLGKLRALGRINKAYTEAKVFIDRTNLTILNN